MRWSSDLIELPKERDDCVWVAKRNMGYRKQCGAYTTNKREALRSGSTGVWFVYAQCKKCSTKKAISIKTARYDKSTRCSECKKPK